MSSSASSSTINTTNTPAPGDGSQPPPPQPPFAFAKTPILQAIECDFLSTCSSSSSSQLSQQQQQNQTPSRRRKRSVQDCLHYKKLPRPEVKRLLLLNSQSQSQSLSTSSSTTTSPPLMTTKIKITTSWQDLHLSNLSLLGSLASLKRQSITSINFINNGNNNNELEDEQQQFHSSMWYISRLSTVLNFLHLLLEYKEDGDGGEDDERQRQERQASNAAREVERNKMAIQVIKSLVGFVCSCLEHYHRNNSNNNKKSDDGDGEGNDGHDDSEDDTTTTTSTNNNNNNNGNELYSNQDATKTFHPYHIALFVLESLIKTQNHYVSWNVFLLCPLWKGMCEIIISSSSTTTTTTTSTASSSISTLLWPSNMIVRCLKCLFDYMVDGTESIILSSHYNANTNNTIANNNQTQQQQQQQHAFQLKVLGFIVARISIFLPVLINHCCCCENDESNDNNIIIKRILYTLSLLRGIGESQQQQQQVQHHHPLLGQLSNKIDKCIMAAIEPGKDSPSLSADNNRLLIPTLLVVLTKNEPPVPTWKKKNSDNNNNTFDITQQAFAVGKTTLLLHVLEQRLLELEAVKKSQQQQQLLQHGEDEPSPPPPSIVWSEQDVDVILSICKCLVFDSLPSMYETLLNTSNDNNNNNNLIITKSIRLIGQTLLLCETGTDIAPSLSVNINSRPGRAGFHRWLVSWLSPPTPPSAPSSPNQQTATTTATTTNAFGGDNYHPLTIELATSILHLHVLGLIKYNNNNAAPADTNNDKAAVVAMPLLSLCVGLLFHVQTNTTLRSNLAKFVVRLMKDPMAGDRVQDLITPPMTKILEQQTNKSKKRKRSSSSSAATTTRQQQQHLGIEDYKVIGWLASNLRLSPGHPLVVAAAANAGWPDSSNGSHIKLRSKKELACLAFCLDIMASALLSSSFNNHNKENNDNNNKNRRQKHQQVCSLIALWNNVLLSAQQSKQKGKQTKSDLRVLSWLGVSVFRYLRCFCDSLPEEKKKQKPAGPDHDAMIQICNLLSRTFSSSSKSNNNKNTLLLLLGGDNTRKAVAITFEAIGVLGSLGYIIRQDCLPPIIQGVCTIFSDLLSSEHWPIRSHALSSFVSFSPSLDVTESKKFLSSCLPGDIVTPFQRRLLSKEGKGGVQPPSSLNLSMAGATCSRILGRTSTIRPTTTTKVFPVTNSYSITSGSYFMTMPAQDGRECIVIFPPGPKSLEDIKFMKDDDDNDAVRVQMVHRAVLSARDGSCCKLLLQDS